MIDSMIFRNDLWKLQLCSDNRFLSSCLFIRIMPDFWLSLICSNRMSFMHNLQKQISCHSFKSKSLLSDLNWLLHKEKLSWNDDWLNWRLKMKLLLTVRAKHFNVIKYARTGSICLLLSCCAWLQINLSDLIYSNWAACFRQTLLPVRLRCERLPPIYEILRIRYRVSLSALINNKYTKNTAILK